MVLDVNLAIYQNTGAIPKSCANTAHRTNILILLTESVSGALYQSQSF